MLRRGSVGLLILAGLFLGCQNTPKPTPPPLQPVPTQENVESARQQLQRVNPNAEVGTVITVWHDLAAITDVDVSKFNVGDPVSFLDGNLNDLTMGHVIKVVGTVLQVQFDAPGAGHREPMKGDLAISMTSPLVRPTRPAGETPAPSPEPSPAPGPATAPETPATAPATTPETPATAPTTAPAPQTPATAPATEPAAPATEPAAPATAPTTDAVPATAPTTDAAPATAPTTDAAPAPDTKPDLNK